MTQQLLTESPEKTKPDIERHEPRSDSAPSFQGVLHPFHQLQRTLGNRNVAKLIQAKRLTPEGKIIGFQRKLTVGAADNQYEQEADRVASQVMNIPDAVAASSIQRAMSPGEDNDKMLQTKHLAASITPFAQRQMVNYEEPEGKEKPVQTKFLTETSGEPLQRQPETEEEETKPIQAKSAESMSDSFEAGDEVETQVSNRMQGGGMHPPKPARAYLEPRFGADFSQVRVYADANAADADAPYGSIQRDDAGTKGVKPPPINPPPAPAPTPLKYDFRAHKLNPPPAGFTLANIKSNLKKKIDAGEIKSATATGVTAGSTEEIFVFYVLWNLAEKTRWGTEADLVTAIGWPAKAGDPEPQGRVTVRIDDQGEASAELVAAGPVPKPPQTTVAAGSTQLKTDYKLTSVRDDGTAKWTDAEISDVVAALALLPKADKLALEGVELIRVKALPDSGIAVFSGGGGVAKGATKITEVPSLKLSDRAFPTAALRFVGGKVGGKAKTVPATFHTILHEVGHAVATAVYRPTNLAYDQAIIESNKRGISLNESAAAYTKAAGDYAALYKQYEATKKAGDARLENSLSAQLLALNKTMDTLLKANRARGEENRKAEAAQKSKEAAVAKTRVPAAVVAPFKADAAA